MGEKKQIRIKRLNKDKSKFFEKLIIFGKNSGKNQRIHNRVWD